MSNPRLDHIVDYPFRRLAALLAEPGGGPTINMAIGEPQHQPPDFVGAILTDAQAGWGKYPPLRGTPALRRAIAGWLNRRFGLSVCPIDAERHVLPLAGTRGGLFQVALLGDPTPRAAGPPVVLVPNPFYQVYAAAGLLAGAEVHFVPAGPDTGFLPDFASLPSAILERTVLAYLCNPSNPQGAVASPAYLAEAIRLARRHGFILAVDECYSEIYDSVPPPGALAACQAAGDDFANLLVFHSLSKRSSAPGLRSGFVAGDPQLIAAFDRVNGYGGGAVPLPIMAASCALWDDEAHVERSRVRYRQNFAIAERILGGVPAYQRPAGGFFLWLPVQDGEQAALALWRSAGIRVLPGVYLGWTDPSGSNPGQAFIRIALVHDAAVTETALHQLHAILGNNDMFAGLPA